MAEISAAQVKGLRDATGLGMMECKKALVESGGDVEQARELLRIRSQSKAEKVAGRSTGEGRVGIAVDGSEGVIAEASCETDFVAKDGNFVAFVDRVCDAALKAEKGAAPESLEGIEQARQELVLKLGENVSVGRVTRLSSSGNGSLASYVHQGSKIGVLADVDPGSGGEELARNLCMHIAAMRPEYLKADDVPAAVKEGEEKIFRAQLEESGKPPEVVEKIVGGKIKKFLEESCLLSQAYIREDGKSVGKMLEEAGASVSGFVRMEIGR